MDGQKKGKVISTRLFGRSPRARARYATGAPATARFMQEKMPDWKFRMYYDDTAPKEIVKSLEGMSNTELIEKPVGKGREGCLWRFEAWDDCEIAVCRDLDFKVQENDLICIDEWLKTDYSVHFAWLVHNRELAWQRKNRRYYMAGCVSARNLPFKVKDLLDAYPGAKSEFGADEYFLGEHFVPEILKHEEKILMHIEPRTRKDKIELWPEKEHYMYLEKDWVGV